MGAVSDRWMSGVSACASGEAPKNQFRPLGSLFAAGFVPLGGPQPSISGPRGHTEPPGFKWGTTAAPPKFLVRVSFADAPGGAFAAWPREDGPVNLVSG